MFWGRGYYSDEAPAPTQFAVFAVRLNRERRAQNEGLPSAIRNALARLEDSMEKLAYLLHYRTDVPGAELRSTLIERVAPALREAGAVNIGVSVDDDHVADGQGPAIVKSDPPVRALVCFWMENADDRGACEKLLAEGAEVLHGYLVVESRPLLHSPPIGERAPGANLVTCIKRRADISDADFIDRWHNEHKIVACEIQSTFGYVRNVVVRALTPDAPDWDGIVEESFPMEALTDPQVWYDCDSDDEYKKRVVRMVESVTAFLDLGPLESMPMSEYYLG